MYYTTNDHEAGLRGRRATIKAHPATPHNPRPYGRGGEASFKVALQIASSYGIVVFTIIGRLPALSRSSRSIQSRE